MGDGATLACARWRRQWRWLSPRTGGARSPGSRSCHRKTETVRADFLRSVTRHGLRGAQMVISAAHERLKAAARTGPGAGCRVPFRRNLRARLGRTHKPVLRAADRLRGEDPRPAYRRWREAADTLRDRFRNLAERMDCANGTPLPVGFEPIAPQWATPSDLGECRARCPCRPGRGRKPAIDARHHPGGVRLRGRNDAPDQVLSPLITGATTLLHLRLGDA